MSRKLKMFLLAAVLVFGFAQAAYADLTAIGPVDPVTGFPFFVQDQDGIQLEPCGIINPDPLDPAINLPPCSLLEVLDPNGGFVAANIAEMFYYVAEAEMLPASGERFRFRAIIEGAGGLLFNTVRLDLRNIVTAGDYTISAVPPFMPADFTVTLPVGDTTVFVPPDATGAAPGFLGAIPGNVQFFVGNGTGINVPPVVGNFVGDGVTLAPLANGSVFTVSGPFGPAGANATVSTPDFMVQGKIAGQVVVLTVNGATFKRGAVPAIQGGHVDVSATSDPLATVTVGGLTPAPVAMTGNGLGSFFAHIPVADPTLLPATVAVTATLPGALPTDPPVVTTVNQPLVDQVKITKAEYNASNQTLTIEASSSDLFGAPTLTALNVDTGANLGALVGGVLSVPLVTTPPNRVRVNSSAGGVARMDVSVTTIRLRLVDFIQSTSTWDLRGNSSMPIGTPVNAFLTRTGALIGSRNVRQNAANGQWVINIAGSLVIPQPGDTITLESAGDRVIIPARILP